MPVSAPRLRHFTACKRGVKLIPDGSEDCRAPPRKSVEPDRIGIMNVTEERLRERLARDGALSFKDFMQEALYGPDGYYRQTSSPIGGQGDFVTGSSLSPLFGRTTARLLERLDAVFGERAELVEVGCGDGRHLQAVASVSPDRSLRGSDLVPRELPANIEAFEGIDEIPERSVQGILFSYELFDALPVHRLIGGEQGSIRELGVELDGDGHFTWVEMSLTDEALSRLVGGSLERGQIADVTPEWSHLYARLARRLKRGLVLTFDYGFARERLFDVRIRRHGTLACYRHHQVHRDAFREVGRQDLTAHIDFTTLTEIGEQEGLRTECFTRQALWLVANGLFDDLADADPVRRVEARTLLDGEGMGQDIRVLVQSRGLSTEGLWNAAVC